MLFSNSGEISAESFQPFRPSPTPRDTYRLLPAASVPPTGSFEFSLAAARAPQTAKLSISWLF
jgi:hypothetical protein